MGKQFRNFFTNDNNNFQNIISPEAVNTVGHDVDTWTGLLIDLINNFDISKRI